MAKVLVIDDEPSIRTLLGHMLQPEHSAVLCPDVAEALAQIRLDSPDLILLDLNLAGEDGIQFLDRRKSDPTLARIPVVVLTALSHIAGGIYRSWSVHDVLQKPVQRDRLLKAIDGALEMPKRGVGASRR